MHAGEVTYQERAFKFECDGRRPKVFERHEKTVEADLSIIRLFSIRQLQEMIPPFFFFYDYVLLQESRSFISELPIPKWNFYEAIQLKLTDECCVDTENAPASRIMQENIQTMSLSLLSWLPR